MKEKLLPLVLIAILLTSCDNEIPITAISFESEAVALRVGESQALHVSTYPADASLRKVRWASSDSNIATVNANGEVIAIAEGRAEISATTNDGSQVATCLVVVVGEPNIVMEVSATIEAFEFPFALSFNSPGIVAIDWGDGSALHVTTNTKTWSRYGFLKKYTDAGAYSIRIYNESIVTLHANNDPFRPNTIRLEGLDVDRSPFLYILNVSNNKLTSLDISQNKMLVNLFAAGNQLINLDVSKNIDLVWLDCEHNKLANLSLNGAISLGEVRANHNQLTALDVSMTPRLRWLFLRNNLFTADAINNLFISLPHDDPYSAGSENPFNRGVWVSENEGFYEADRSIARNKGWMSGSI